MKKTKWVSLVLPFITLMLEILPYGVKFRFFGGAQGTTSYFDFAAFGMGIFPPFITAVLTVLLALLLLGSLFIKKDWCLRGASHVACTAFVVSLFLIFYGLAYISVVGVLISLTLCAEWLLLRKLLNVAE